jgi:hypothetical protein
MQNLPPDPDQHYNLHQVPVGIAMLDFILPIEDGAAEWTRLALAA